jgi:hypothetical protein
VKDEAHSRERVSARGSSIRSARDLAIGAQRLEIRRRLDSFGADDVTVIGQRVLNLHTLRRELRDVIGTKNALRVEDEVAWRFRGDSNGSEEEQGRDHHR